MTFSWRTFLLITLLISSNTYAQGPWLNKWLPGFLKIKTKVATKVANKKFYQKITIPFMPGMSPEATEELLIEKKVATTLGPVIIHKSVYKKKIVKVFKKNNKKISSKKRKKLILNNDGPVKEVNRKYTFKYQQKWKGKNRYRPKAKLKTKKSYRVPSLKGINVKNMDHEDIDVKNAEEFVETFDGL